MSLGDKGAPPLRLRRKIVMALKENLRIVYFRSRFFRYMARWLVPGKRLPMDLSHVLSFREDQIGTVDRDEALSLLGLTRILCPQTIVEFGFLSGHSALNFLLAARPDCRVFSYDISDNSEEIARRCLRKFRNFRFIRKSQTDFSPSDIDHRKIDLCFLDASHDLSLNLKTFDLVQPHLAEGAVFAVHDTGVWHRKFFTEGHYAFIESNLGRKTGRWIDADQYQQAVTERLFVNTLLRNYPDFSQVHLHSSHTLRNGITLLQKTRPLVTGPEPEKKNDDDLKRSDPKINATRAIGKGVSAGG
jgi:predicted O-methyltransferase YrrM